jgi:hypothetical protein
MSAGTFGAKRRRYDLPRVWNRWPDPWNMSPGSCVNADTACWTAEPLHARARKHQPVSAKRSKHDETESLIRIRARQVRTINRPFIRGRVHVQVVMCERRELR